MKLQRDLKFTRSYLSIPRHRTNVSTINHAVVAAEILVSDSWSNDKLVRFMSTSEMAAKVSLPCFGRFCIALEDSCCPSGLGWTEASNARIAARRVAYLPVRGVHECPTVDHLHRFHIVYPWTWPNHWFDAMAGGGSRGINHACRLSMGSFCRLI
ncbi:hypothetical protein M378DRAFT_727903 [Amanita muscaria Koide BX008]|uniref:Uncharacterized protein n=1 Tax=Amanita muscaria (strain Koide BX008) TaxID=946122 RepID=A0A0C2SLK9_AMAMK|nr:hypothetical protein M378DRAFT_727903 [Amanita muscaria Koide BX008]